MSLSFFAAAFPFQTARQLPSSNHRGLAVHRARVDFRANAGLQDGEQIALAVQLAHTQLDNLQHQLRHMNEIMNENTLTHNAPKPS